VRHSSFNASHGALPVHRHCIAHCDLKAENVLISVDGTVKLADFGASVHVFADTLPAGKLFGSPYFLAPEVLQRQRYGLAVDVWAFGCTVLQMVSGQPPWSGMHLKTMPALLQAMQQSQSRAPPLPASLGLAVRELLACCFKWEPQQRPHAFELLSHGLCNNDNKHCAQCKRYTCSSCSIDAESELGRSSNSNSNVIGTQSKDVGFSSHESLLSNSPPASTRGGTCISVSIKVDIPGLSSNRTANPYARRDRRKDIKK
jgi:serine/threonine protein kinase